MEEWMNSSWWLYDLTVAAIVILCVWGGWRKGFFRTLSSLAGYGAAVLLAAVLARPTAEYVYDKWLMQRCCQLLEQKLDACHLDDQIESALSVMGVTLDPATLQQIADHPEDASHAFYTTISQKTGLPVAAVETALSQTVDTEMLQHETGLPVWMVQAIVPDDMTAKELQNRTVQTAALLLAGDTHTASSTLLRQYLRPALLIPLKAISFSVLFFGISIVLQLLLKWLGCLRKTEAGNLWDQSAGAAVGGLTAIVLLIIMIKLTGWLVSAGGGQQAFFRDSVIEKTMWFHYLYDCMP